MAAPNVGPPVLVFFASFLVDKIFYSNDFSETRVNERPHREDLTAHFLEKSIVRSGTQK